MIRNVRQLDRKSLDVGLLSIKERAEQLMQGVQHQINIVMHRGKAILEVKYTDYRPARQMRSELLAIADGHCKVIVTREYSTEFIKSALYDLFVQDTEAVVTYAQGKLEATPLRIFVNNMLDEKQQF